MLGQSSSRERLLTILVLAGVVILVLAIGLGNQSQPSSGSATPQGTTAQIVSTSVLVGVTFDPNRTPPTAEPGAGETSRALVRQARRAPTTAEGAVSPVGLPANIFRLNIWLSALVALIGLLTIVGLELRKRSRKR